MTNRIALAPALALAAALLVAACSSGDKGYARDGDTGAAAPATTRDMSATPNAGDSTTGVTSVNGPRPTSNAAGDTLGARAKTGGAIGASTGATARP